MSVRACAPWSSRGIRRGVQDRYAGDVGDFGKLGLLRTLAGADLKLAVLWFRVPDESHNADGMHVSYLSRRREAEFRPCDPCLYDAMRAIVANGPKRQVVSLEPLFPAGTTFHREPLVFLPHESRTDRDARRQQGLREAATTAQGSDLIFCDPDNGVAPDTVRTLQQRSPKYVFAADLPILAKAEQSIIICHHANRRSPVVEQVCSLLDRLRDVTKRHGFALIFRRGTCRIYAVQPARRHRPVLEERVTKLLRGPWGQHFERVDVEVSARSRA